MAKMSLFRNRHTTAALALLVGSGLAGTSMAEDPGQALAAPPPPPQLQDGEPLEPEVTILRTDREIVYEYRRNGELFMVRVQPRVGPPYFFVDIDGDGVLDYSPTDPRTPNVNQWVIYQW